MTDYWYEFKKWFGFFIPPGSVFAISYCLTEDVFASIGWTIGIMILLIVGIAIWYSQNQK